MPPAMAKNFLGPRARATRDPTTAGGRQQPASHTSGLSHSTISSATLFMRTIGFFTDPSIGIVQCPHAFYNHDPMRQPRDASTPTSNGFSSMPLCRAATAGMPRFVVLELAHAARRSISRRRSADKFDRGHVAYLTLLRGYALFVSARSGSRPRTSIFVQRQRCARCDPNPLRATAPSAENLRFATALVPADIGLGGPTVVGRGPGADRVLRPSAGCKRHCRSNRLLSHSSDTRRVGRIGVYARSPVPLAAQVLGHCRSFKILPIVLFTPQAARPCVQGDAEQRPTIDPRTRYLWSVAAMMLLTAAGWH